MAADCAPRGSQGLVWCTTYAVDALTRCDGPGPWLTVDRPLKSNRFLIQAIRARSNGAGVRAGRWLAGEEAHGGGAMAGDSVLAETTF